MADLRKAAQMALETLDNMVKVDWHEWDEFASVEDFVRWAKSRASFTAEALRAALAQPEQEPVAWISNSSARMIHWSGDTPAYGEDWKPLYTAPPQREWVGLTDDEYFYLQMKIKTPMVSVGDYINAMKMVEEKLKDKNGF